MMQIFYLAAADAKKAVSFGHAWHFKLETEHCFEEILTDVEIFYL